MWIIIDTHACVINIIIMNSHGCSVMYSNCLLGHIMADLVGRWLGADMVDFEPKHSNGLSNEFRCYVNYDSSNTKFCQVKQERKEE
jgi:hypothetical protein